MKRITRRKRRVNLYVRGFNKWGKRILCTARQIPAALMRLIEASSAVEFKVGVRYGKAKTNSGKVEDVVNEVEGNKKEVLRALKIFLSASELDEAERYWKFV